MVSMIDNVIHQSQMYFAGLTKWENKLAIRTKVGPYVLEMAQTQEQLLECFRLRFEVFCKEMAGSTRRTGLDFDKYDNYCDHLIITHEPTKKIVGTYRMNFSETSEMFYTGSEFEISSWLKMQKTPFIELGRACIDKDHRRGTVISLLWKGIADYMQMMKADKLIGCSSVKVTDARSAALIFRYFQEKGQLAEHVFTPHDKYRMKDLLFWLMLFSSGLSEYQIKEAEEKIPSLLKSYIKAGAKVASYPAYDRDFSCIDFMTVVNRSDLDQKLVRKLTGG